MKAQPRTVRPGTGRAIVTTRVTPKGSKSFSVDEMVAQDIPGAELQAQLMSQVTVGVGQTINLGNFNMMRLDVTVMLPGNLGEERETYERASEYAAGFLTDEKARWGISDEQAGS